MPTEDKEAHLEAPEPAEPAAPARSRVSSVSSSTSSNGTPRRRLAIAPVSVGKSKGSPVRIPEGDTVHSYMSQLALKEARVSELMEQQKAIQLELQAAEFDLRQYKQRGLRQLNPVAEPKLKARSVATTADLHRGVRESLSRSPSPQRRAREDSQVKRVVGEIGSQFWSFVEDVKTAALGDEEQERGRGGSHKREHKREHNREHNRELDASQYLYN